MVSTLWWQKKLQNLKLKRVACVMTCRQDKTKSIWPTLKLANLRMSTEERVSMAAKMWECVKTPTCVVRLQLWTKKDLAHFINSVVLRCLLYPSVEILKWMLSSSSSRVHLGREGMGATQVSDCLHVSLRWSSSEQTESWSDCSVSRCTGGMKLSTSMCTPALQNPIGSIVK